MKAKVFLLSLLVLAACGKDQPKNDEPKIIDDEGPEVGIITHYYIPSNAGNEIYPRIGFELEDWMVAELSYPGFAESKVDIFNFVKNRNESYMLTLSEDGLAIAGYNAMTGTLANEVLTASVKNGTLRVAQVNWYEDDVAVTNISETTVETKAYYKTKAGEESALRKTFFDMFSQIGNDVSFMSPFFQPFANAGTLCSIWKEVIVPIAHYKLYEDDPDMLEEMLIHKEMDKLGRFTVSKVVGKDFQSTMSFFDDVLRKAGEYVPYDNDHATGKESLGHQPSIASKMNQFIRTAKSAEREYRVDLSLLSKTPVSATVTIDVTKLTEDASEISYVRLLAGETGKYISQRDIIYNLPAQRDINSLEPGKYYTVIAELETYSGAKYTDGIEIFTPTELALSPEVLTVPADGGENAFGVTVPDPDWTWKIVDQPSWCTVTAIGKQSFFFKASPANSEREGAFVVEATNGMETRQAQGLVRQTGSKWDGTAWSANIAISVSATGPDADKVQYGHGLDHVEFMVTDALHGGFQGGPWSSMRASGNVLTFSYSSTETATEEGMMVTRSENVTMTVIWVDGKTARVSVSGKTVFSGGASAVVTITGSATATRIN